MYGIVYKATNTLNGHVYVGQTVRTLHDRKLQHLSDSRKGNFRFYYAIRKHGIDSFTWEIIDTAESKEELDLKEQKWISELGSIGPNGYNCKTGGANGRPSEDVKRRISEKLRGRKKNLTEEGRERKREASRNRVWSDESRAKISAAQKGKPNLSEVTEKIRSKITGKIRSDEAKQHYLECWTEERRQERSEKYSGTGNPNYGKHLSEEARKSISEKAKARGPRVQSEEERKKRSDSIREWHWKRRLQLSENMHTN